jgi:predicted transcriptional regulator
MGMNVGSDYSEKDYLQNIGVMTHYAYMNIKTPSNRDTFVAIARESLGQGNAETLHKTQEHWANKLGITRKTFNKTVQQLEADGYITINRCTKFVWGSGSIAYSYSPVVPDSLKEYIKLNDNTGEIDYE